MSKKTVYVVVKVAWDYTDEYYARYDIYNPTPIRVFLTHQDASVYRRELEKKARDEWDYELNIQWKSLEHIHFPLTFHNHEHKLEDKNMWVSFCSLSWKEFQERIRPFNLPPPEPEPEYTGCLTNTGGMWFAKGFWEAVRALPDEQYHAFYDLFDKLNFYEVVEVYSDSIEEPERMLEEQDRRMQALLDAYNEGDDYE
jgi:hypothetical protein